MKHVREVTVIMLLAVSNFLPLNLLVKNTLLLCYKATETKFTVYRQQVSLA